MILIKFVKSENKLFNVLSMGIANFHAYDVYIDKKVVATLRPGMETEISLQPGTYQVFFKLATLGGSKSNKLTVNIEPNKDYIIEALQNMGAVTASFSILQSKPKPCIEFINVNCKCGAPNKIAKGKSMVCEYCGMLINA